MEPLAHLDNISEGPEEALAAAAGVSTGGKQVVECAQVASKKIKNDARKRSGAHVYWHCTVKDCVCTGRRVRQPERIRHSVALEEVHAVKCIYPERCRPCENNQCKCSCFQRVADIFCNCDFSGKLVARMALYCGARNQFARPLKLTSDPVLVYTTCRHCHVTHLRDHL